MNSASTEAEVVRQDADNMGPTCDDQKKDLSEKLDALEAALGVINNVGRKN